MPNIVLDTEFMLNYTAEWMNEWARATQSYLSLTLLGCLPADHDISHGGDHNTAEGDDENYGKDGQAIS